MNKGKAWKLLGISWRLFLFLLMQDNACFAWVKMSISFFQKCWSYVILLLWEGSRLCTLRFLAWKNWNVVTCVSSKSHLCGPVFREVLRQTTRDNERGGRSPLYACWHWFAIETVVSEIPSHLWCYTVFWGKYVQVLSVCTCAYIVTSICLPRAAGSSSNPAGVGWRTLKSPFCLISSRNCRSQSMPTCGSRQLSIQILIIHLLSAGFWPKTVMALVWPEGTSFASAAGREKGRLLLEICPI